MNKKKSFIGIALKNIKSYWRDVIKDPELSFLLMIIDDNETVGFDPQAHGKNLLNHILAANKNYHGGIELYDLHNELSVAKMAMTFGLSDAQSVNNPASFSSYPKAFRPVCDTDENYDSDKHPYLMGYNSYNYDTTMLALFFNEVYFAFI